LDVSSHAVGMNKAKTIQHEDFMLYPINQRHFE